MKRILIRDHYCDDYFCSCEREAYDLDEKKFIKIKFSLLNNIDYIIYRSSCEPTKSSHVKEKYIKWDYEEESKSY